MRNRIYTIHDLMESETEREAGTKRETKQSNNHTNPFLCCSRQGVASKYQLLSIDSGDRVMNKIDNILCSQDLHLNGIG